MGAGLKTLPPREQKASAVRRMFDAIAPRYDLLNHLLSLNQDRRWRRIAVERLLQHRPAPGWFLDACAGTLDLGLALARQPAFRGRIAASDFALAMLRTGAHKATTAPIDPVCADALRLPFVDATFEAALVGFGVRNLADLDDGLRELARVVKPGAPLVVLEFTTPTWPPFRSLYLFYFRRVLPWLGRLVSRHRSAYAYLPASVLEFPAPAALADRMRAAGFRDVEWETLTGGIVAVHAGIRGQGSGIREPIAAP
ncbi:MAG: ubiquinone/menaquinone biosynthesis methyltransferase [Gemmatimonadetes bacterium]|nr:ubiquinone/menaquinone biosynthesis methyltransferase [Gemmatimonadota bacterium]